MHLTLTAVIGIDPCFQFVGTQQPSRFRDGPLAMHPFGLNRIEPRAFHRQPKGHAAYPVACGFHLLIVLAQPGAYRRTLVPRCTNPNQVQRSEPSDPETFTPPGQDRHGHRTHRAALHKPEQHLVGMRWSGAQQQPITGQGLWVCLLLGTCQGIQSGDTASLAPAMLRGVGQAAPPHLISKAQPPGGLGMRQAHQAVPTIFFRRYAGSGLVIQCLARFQRTPSWAIAARMVSALTRRCVSPWSKLTSAASARVHTLVAWPKTRGLWCKSSRSRSRPSASKVA